VTNQSHLFFDPFTSKKSKKGRKSSKKAAKTKMRSILGLI
jgi:hypothetical protein